MANASSNSSNVDTQEEVTLNPSPPAKKQGTMRLQWIITLKAKDISNSSIRSWVETHCKNAVWQLERGDESGYIHYQMTINLKVKNRLSWLTSHFSKIAHCEWVKSHDKAYEYSQKCETRIAGPYYYPAPLTSVKDPLEGKDYRPWQQNIINIISDEPDERTIHWFWEHVGNIGKTSFCKHLVITRDATYVLGKKADIYYAINNNIKLLLIDIPRTIEGKIDYLYEILECVKNGMIFSGKYESKTKVFNAPHVIVFANFPPNIEMLSKDRWNIHNLNPIAPEQTEDFNPLDADF